MEADAQVTLKALCLPHNTLAQLQGKEGMADSWSEIVIAQTSPSQFDKVRLFGRVY